MSEGYSFIADLSSLCGYSLLFLALIAFARVVVYYVVHLGSSIFTTSRKPGTFNKHRRYGRHRGKCVVRDWYQWDSPATGTPASKRNGTSKRFMHDLNSDTGPTVKGSQQSSDLQGECLSAGNLSWRRRNLMGEVDCRVLGFIAIGVTVTGVTTCTGTILHDCPAVGV